MSTIPSDDRQLVAFCVAHKDAWVLYQAQIGVSAAQNTAMAAALLSAQKALDAAETARAVSKGATTSFKSNSRSLRDICGDIVRTVQTFAKNNNNPAVYGLANIPAPQPRSENAPPPGQPSDIRASVNTDGSLTLTWKSNNPSGVSNVVYKVQRAFNGINNYTLLDTVGERTFADMTIPFGTTSVSYIITGKRGSQTGPMSNTFTAQFGSVSGGGGLTIVATQSAPAIGMKMAA